MTYDTWLPLDQLEVSCKEFEESYRMVFSQVVTGLERLGSDLADTERMKTEAEGGIVDMQTRFGTTESSLKSLKRSYHTTRKRNACELALRQDDQEVFTAVLQLSKCPNDYGDDAYPLAQSPVCLMDNCTVGVSDASLAEKVNRSPQVQQALRGFRALEWGEFKGW